MVDVTKSCQLPDLATPQVDLFPSEFVNTVTLAYRAIDNSVRDDVIMTKKKKEEKGVKTFQIW